MGKKLPKKLRLDEKSRLVQFLDYVSASNFSESGRKKTSFENDRRPAALGHFEHLD
jgi:hypothetical protein